MIFNNADKPELLRDYWPVDSPGSVLMTSRDPKADKTMFYLISGINVDVLDTADASPLIYQFTRYPENEQSVQQASVLAERLAGLPLAILQISAYMRRRDLTIQETLNLAGHESSFIELHGAQDHSGHTLANV